MAEQFFTKCMFCGQQILMTRNLKNGNWIPCDPELRKFTPGGGPNTYITPEGEMVRGCKTFGGKEAYGYKRHKTHRKDSKK